MRCLAGDVISYYRSKALQSFACICDLNAILSLFTVSTSRHTVSAGFSSVLLLSQKLNRRGILNSSNQHKVCKSPCLVGNLDSFFFFGQFTDLKNDK